MSTGRHRECHNFSNQPCGLCRERRLGPQTMFIYCDTSDAGADQVARRRHIKAAVADLDCFLYVDVNCLLHQYHLMVRDGLQLIDEFLRGLRETHPHVTAGFEAYTSNLAKCSNFWRTHVAQFIQSWENIHGFGKASCRTAPEPVRYRQYPLAVISGRWGSVESCECFFIQRSRQLMEPVYMAVLSSYVKSKKGDMKRNASSQHDSKRGVAEAKAKAASKSEKPDLLDSNEDRESYQIKMTKWADGAMSTIRNQVFWLLLHVANKARSPLSHFFAWAQQNSNNRLIQQLVTHKAEEFQAEFSNLLLSFDEWFSKALLETGVQGLPSEVLQLLRTLSFKLVAQGAGNFAMRIGMHVQRPALCVKNHGSQ